LGAERAEQRLEAKGRRRANGAWRSAKVAWLIGKFGRKQENAIRSR
jgi:hypothetical protein